MHGTLISIYLANDSFYGSAAAAASRLQDIRHPHAVIFRIRRSHGTKKSEHERINGASLWSSCSVRRGKQKLKTPKHRIRAWPRSNNT